MTACRQHLSTTSPWSASRSNIRNLHWLQHMPCVIVREHVHQSRFCWLPSYDNNCTLFLIAHFSTVHGQSGVAAACHQGH